MPSPFRAGSRYPHWLWSPRCQARSGQVRGIPTGSGARDAKPVPGRFAVSPLQTWSPRCQARSGQVRGIPRLQGAYRPEKETALDRTGGRSVRVALRSRRLPSDAPPDRSTRHHTRPCALPLRHGTITRADKRTDAARKWPPRRQGPIATAPPRDSMPVYQSHTVFRGSCRTLGSPASRLEPTVSAVPGDTANPPGTGDGIAGSRAGLFQETGLGLATTRGLSAVSGCARTHAVSHGTGAKPKRCRGRRRRPCHTHSTWPRRDMDCVRQRAADAARRRRFHGRRDDGGHFLKQPWLQGQMRGVTARATFL